MTVSLLPLLSATDASSSVAISGGESPADPAIQPDPLLGARESDDLNKLSIQPPARWVRLAKLERGWQMGYSIGVGATFLVMLVMDLGPTTSYPTESEASVVVDAVRKNTPSFELTSTRLVHPSGQRWLEVSGNFTDGGTAQSLVKLFTARRGRLVLVHFEGTSDAVQANSELFRRVAATVEVREP